MTDRRAFTWERKPFIVCPLCGLQRFGMLSAGGDRLTMRCADCRYSESELLPELDKKVIYLDQLVFSALFSVEAGGRLPPGHEDFCREMHRRLKRVVLLQQAILPHSDIHHNETIVFHSARALQQAYENLGGDVPLTRSHDVHGNQLWQYLSAYIEKREPTVDLSVDAVLDKPRNRWLDDMRVFVDADYSRFAEGIRNSRERSHDALTNLVAIWAEEKLPFPDMLARELGSFGVSRRDALRYTLRRIDELSRNNDPMAFLELSLEPILDEVRTIEAAFEKAGVAPEERGAAMHAFWDWERNAEQPFFRISAYLFAAVANRAVSGQKRFSRGLMNDIRAIATYAPYVDAMFVDRECATILAQEPLASDLNYRARIFSFNDTDAFLAYLDEVEAGATPEIRGFAKRIYGVET